MKAEIGTPRPESMDNRLGAATPSSGMLAVDLDGTLIATDLLLESFRSACRRDVLTPARAGWALLRGGRPGLKRALAASGPLEPAALPYNAAVISYVRKWRQNGGRAALVTAADHGLAESVARHVAIFDEVHGTRPGHNLKGAAKARFLVDRFGDAGFVYVGDSTADLDVWAHARGGVTVGASARLRARVEALGRPVEHLPGARAAGPPKAVVRR